MHQPQAETLSERQRLILDGLVAGKSNGVLAEELGITVDGVKWHVSEMLWDTGCNDRHELAAWWRRERGPRPRTPVFAFRRPSPASLAGTMRFASTLALTAVLVAAIYAGWTCSSTAAPATLTTASPLGKIAYVQDGDIYVKRLPDGTPQRITTGSKASSPQWSPSGEWLLYAQDGHSLVSRADGSDARPAAGVWAPASDRLAYLSSSDVGDLSGADAVVPPANEIVVENADGSGRKVIAHAEPPGGETGSLSDPTWSDDGVHVAYVEFHGRLPFSFPPGAHVTPTPTYEAIRVVSVDGAQPEEMYVEDAPPRDGVGLIHWSHGGLLFYRKPGFSADLGDGVTLKLLNPSITTSTEGVPPPTAWHFSPTQPVTISPANPTILLDPTLRSMDNPALYAITDGNGRATWTGKRIAGVSWASANVFDLTARSVAAIQPAVSPDRQRIAYSAMPDAPNLSGGDPTKQALMQRKIWSLDMSQLNCKTQADCSPPTQQLTSDPAYRDEYPQWSADGSQILFVRMDAQDNASLWIMNADGSDQRELVDRFDIPAAADATTPWFGYYGTISWHQSLAWWRPRTPPTNGAPTPDASPEHNTLSIPSLGLTVQYPPGWDGGAAPMPYASCVSCSVLGPASAEHPYGVEIFDMPVNYDALGCCSYGYVGNNTIGIDGGPVGGSPGSTRMVRVAGIDAQQVEFRRNAPLGLAAETGDYTPYREIWTALPWSGGTLFITAFFRDGDTAAEQETRAAYDLALTTLAATP